MPLSIAQAGELTDLERAELAAADESYSDGSTAPSQAWSKRLKDAGSLHRSAP